MNRRLALALLALGSVPVRLDSAAWNEFSQSADVDRWLDLQEAWNPFAEKLNSGVFDAKGWKKVSSRLRALGVCDGKR